MVLDGFDVLLEFLGFGRLFRLLCRVAARGKPLKKDWQAQQSKCCACRFRESHQGAGTSRGLASQLNPEYIFIICPLPRLPPWQLSILSMQLSVHIASTVLSQAPNQSAWKVEPRGCPGAIASEDNAHLDVSSPWRICHRAESVKE